MSDPAHALICGAGPAGLTAGLLLARNGWKVTIAERDTELRGGGFLVSIADLSWQRMRTLGFIDALTARAAGITRTSYHDASGRTLMSLDTRRLFGDVQVLQLLRDDLVDVLFTAAQAELDLHMGCTVSHAENTPAGVDVRFDNGDAGSFDVIIGADGVHSRLRELLFADDTREHYLDLCCAAYRSPNVLGLEHKFETHTERNRYMATFSTRTEDIGSVFVWASEQRNPPATNQRAALKAAFVDCAAATATVLDACPDGPFYFDVLEQVQVSRWVKGNSTLR